MTATTNNSNNENNYIRFCYGLQSNLPIVEDKDGFRLHIPRNEIVDYISAGWKLVPKTENCPECGGSGKVSSESMARYGDEPYTCLRCNGAGHIPTEL